MSLLFGAAAASSRTKNMGVFSLVKKVGQPAYSYTTGREERASPEPELSANKAAEDLI